MVFGRTRARPRDRAGGRPRRRSFTQLDPIGLAGGLNLYGFAGGDPVNYSDPFGLEVEFKNDKNGAMAASWAHAKRALASLASDGDIEADNALSMMRWMESSEAGLYTFENAALGGGLGNARGRHASIDVDAIGRARADGTAVNVASTMVHEAGHLWYQNTAMYALRPDGDASNLNAMSWDNAYRRSVDMPERRDHNSYPPRP